MGPNYDFQPFWNAANDVLRRQHIPGLEGIYRRCNDRYLQSRNRASQAPYLDAIFAMTVVRKENRILAGENPSDLYGGQGVDPAEKRTHDRARVEQLLQQYCPEHTPKGEKQLVPA